MEFETRIQKAKTDAEGFRDLYQATIDRVFSYLLIRTKSRELSVDISQNVYVALWRALPTFRFVSEEAWWGFLFTIVRRELYRARHNQIKNEVSWPDVFDIAAPEETHEDYRSLIKATESLPEKERLTISLRYFSDLSFRDIATLLSITENYAKVLHHRAITKLQKIKNHYA